MSKFSFIIPVFNVEKYLHECILSVLNQTNTDFEIILVDDGSTDSSPEICDYYDNEYTNTQCIHQKNRGLSGARNTGLRAARGQYVIFLDSDDYWADENGLEQLDILSQSNPDIIFFSSYNVRENSENAPVRDRYLYPEEFNELTPFQALQRMVQEDLLNLSACKKVYKREFLIKNELWFVEGIKSEDIDYNLRVFNLLPECRFYGQPLYVYRHREGSITKTVDDNHLEDYFAIVEKFAHFEYADDKIRNLLLSYVAYQHSLLLAYSTVSHTEKARMISKKLEEYTYLYQYTDYPRTRKIRFAMKFLGIGLTKTLLSWYLKKRS